MGCSSCSSGSDGTPKGCGSKGGCSTGGCNKLNTFDWLSHIDLPDYGSYDLVEVSFKNGARKEIFKKPEFVHIATGDHVAVESTASGYDVGKVSLMGELVHIQLKKHRIKDNAVLPNILRIANERDLERLTNARESEREAMIRARVIVRDLGLEMKIGDVEYQGDKRKITFYYTADGRVDFRELIRVFAREYKVKIEMRQIGARQESARIGGIGSCGRELCCSTWLTNFKSVSTVAARYQNLAINQSKLSGQCGRLKCCLNYELNTYLEVLQEFPKNVNSIKTKKGNAILIKTDIFKRIMYFAYRTEFGISEVHQLSVEQVKELNAQNKKGILPEDLKDVTQPNTFIEETEEIGFVDGAGSLELKQLETKKKRNRNRNRNKNKNKNNSNKSNSNKPVANKTESKTERTSKSSNRSKKSNNNPKTKSKQQNKTVNKTVANNKSGDSKRTTNSRQKKVNSNPNSNSTNSNTTPKNKTNSRNRNRNRNRRKNQGPKSNNNAKNDTNNSTKKD
ncbi:regulatory iron-sulfur-containing complex subunit RicT [Aureispira sp. CCB-E]|uniref:PSP1 domain-containing protein n=1 Tax=Aureispira sp. CCB-E TaxID=3051121 RepID=UPI002868A5A9|nr:regulatory iron-sulfur-containing complex subunit RicT [Aureispira sp. CCB-E]WMX15125.1 regulatory iron-sulfur-containing complex subunit RicT [Aureispira sp. CCB-E]